jgi:hypothetical protein
MKRDYLLFWSVIAVLLLTGYGNAKILLKDIKQKEVVTVDRFALANLELQSQKDEVKNLKQPIVACVGYKEHGYCMAR